MWHAALIVATWMTVGGAAALALQRRGHDLRSLLGLGLVLGPLFVPLAVEFVRRREPATTPISVADGHGDRDGRRAYVVVLGDPDDAADALPVLRRFDDVGEVTLVGLIDFESAQRATWDETKAVASARLEQAAQVLREFAPGRALAPGRIDTAIGSLPLRPDDVVVVVGDAATGDLERAGNVAGVPLIRVPANSGRD